MRVLHVITGLRSGGAETQLDLLLGHYRHEHEVAALYDVGPVGRRIAGRGVRVHDLGMRTNLRVGAALRLGALMRGGRYDVVHVHLYRACVYGRTAARLAGVPVVVTTEHSLGETQIEGRTKTRAVRFLYLATDLFSDATLAVSPRVRERLVEWGVPERKIRVVPNGVDFRRFAFDPRTRASRRAELGVPPEAFVVGAVGRLHPFKRYDLLLRAAEPLLRRGARVLLVGEGTERPRLEELARRTGHPRRVTFAGPREDVPELLSAMDLFAAPSQEETFGLSVVEALAAGLPAVVAACPALDGLNPSGVRRVSGDPAELRDALLDAYARRHRPGRPAARHDGGPDERLGRLYDARSVATAHEELYEELLDGRRGAG